MVREAAGFIVAAPGKLKRWIKEFQAIIAAGILDPARALEWAGRLQWASSLSANKLGRACLKAIHAQAHRSTRGFRMSRWPRRCLEWWLKFLTALPEIWRSLDCSQLPHLVTWCDGAGGAKAVGAFIWHKSFGWKWTRWVVSQVVICSFLERGGNQIGMVELIGMVVSLYTWEFELNDNQWTAYIDNNGAMFAMRNGSANDMEVVDTKRLVGSLWPRVAQINMDLFLGRVESKANGADEPSRDCYDLALELNAVFVPRVVPP